MKKDKILAKLLADIMLNRCENCPYDKLCDKYIENGLNLCNISTIALKYLDSLPPEKNI